MEKSKVRALIEEIGIVPAIRTYRADRARFAAEAVNRAGIPIAEITMTVPGALEVIEHMAKTQPEMAVGAGTVLDIETAHRCLDAGARFLTSTGLVPEVVEFAIKHDILVFPGALTPTEVIAAWKLGADLVKVFPCGAMGGAPYIRTLKLPFPHIPLIATGGVNQQTAGSFILAGATALGIGSQLINPEFLPDMRESQISELARRYLGMIKTARAQRAGESV